MGLSKENLLYLCNNVHRLRDEHLDKLANKFDIQQTDNKGNYICKYKELLDRLQLVMESPTLAPKNEYEEKLYSSFITWIISSGQRRSSLKTALSFCAYYMVNYMPTPDIIGRMGDVLWRHTFGSMTKNDATDVVNGFYLWLGVDNLKSCLKYLDNISTTHCLILKIRALIVITDYIANN